MRTIGLLLVGAGMALAQSGTVSTGPFTGPLSFSDPKPLRWVETAEPQVFRLSPPQKLQVTALEAKISAAQARIADGQRDLLAAQWALQEWEEKLIAEEGEQSKLVLTGDLSIIPKTFVFSKHHDYLLEMPQSIWQ